MHTARYLGQHQIRTEPVQVRGERRIVRGERRIIHSARGFWGGKESPARREIPGLSRGKNQSARRRPRAGQIGLQAVRYHTR
jgi:hypothetical protein